VTAAHFLLVDTELLGVSGSELTEGEGPSVQTGTESDGTLLGVDLCGGKHFMMSVMKKVFEYCQLTWTSPRTASL